LIFEEYYLLLARFDPSLNVHRMKRSKPTTTIYQKLWFILLNFWIWFHLSIVEENKDHIYIDFSVFNRLIRIKYSFHFSIEYWISFIKRTHMEIKTKMNRWMLDTIVKKKSSVLIYIYMRQMHSVFENGNIFFFGTDY